MKEYFVLISILLFGLVGNSQTSYTTVQDGDWGDPATWGGVYVSSFFPTPVVGLNWFTTGMGDTIHIFHNLNMDYNVFVRDSDIVVIETTGTLNSTTNDFYNLSNGSGVLAYGVFVNGMLGVNYLRNSARLQVGSLGSINASGVGALNGQIENFGTIIQGGAVIADTQIDHNTGSWDIISVDGVRINNGNFNNRAAITFLTGCINVVNGNFNNLLGGTMSSLASGFVIASGDIDNSANGIGAWIGVEWCAGNSGLNLFAILEDCTNSCAVILSVELLNFSGRITSNGHELTWSTQSETNHDYFDIERSEDGITFFPIGQVRGQGNTNQQTNHSFLDESPLSGPNYYRLHMVDYHGESSYSENVVLHPKTENQLSYFPNPVMDWVTIQSDEAIQQVQLFSSNHTLIHTLPIQNNQIDLSDFLPGLYFIQVKQSTSVEYLKVVKQ